MTGACLAGTAGIGSVGCLVLGGMAGGAVAGALTAGIQLAQSGKPLTWQSALGVAQSAAVGAAFGALGGLAGAGAGMLLGKVATSLAGSLAGGATGGSLRTALTATAQRATQRISQSLLPSRPVPQWMDSALPNGSAVSHSPTATAIGGDVRTMNNFANSVGANGRHDVIVHGTAGGRPLVDGEVVSTQQIISAIRENPDYVAGCSITLVMCHGGREAAQEIAETLQVDVYTSMRQVALDPVTGALLQGDF